ncbi:MAG: F0F1 ATP synthase subunit B [Chloroflexota bacterium]|nr:F0F1 ATP synthase subunit B [Chloroflexota bacterium]
MGLDGLGFDLDLLLIGLLNFLLLLVLLRAVVYKPVLKMLDERSEKIRVGMEQADRIKDEALQAEQNVKTQIEAGHRDAQSIVAKAAEISERLKEEARQEAKQEVEVIIAKARADIEKERAEALEQLRQEFVDLSIAAAERVIETSLDKKMHQKLIESVLKEGIDSRN